MTVRDDAPDLMDRLDELQKENALLRERMMAIEAEIKSFKERWRRVSVGFWKRGPRPKPCRRDPECLQFVHGAGGGVLRLRHSLNRGNPRSLTSASKRGSS
jgi:hypothetical protein